MKFLIIGANGQVGHELQRSLAALGRVTAVDYPELDIADTAALRAYVRAQAPDVLFNAAAYTAVDRAEADEATALAVNGTAPGVMAAEMADAGGLLVHYSTDYVFDGRTPGARVETDPPHPLSAYGRTKLAGEQAVAAAGGAHLIFRTAWVYGRRGGNFMLTMIRLMRERDELRVVADQHGTPTWCRTLADIPARIVRDHWLDPAKRAVLASGLYHLTNGGETTWHEYALAIRDLAPELAQRRHVTVHPIATAEYPLPAPRPAYSVLDNGRLARTFGIRAADWREALAVCLGE
ncbi:MAG: dTDP-4-dehydrorhamnose reductase [Betaproteobacteria bacterium]